MYRRRLDEKRQNIYNRFKNETKEFIGWLEKTVKKDSEYTKYIINTGYSKIDGKMFCYITIYPLWEDDLIPATAIIKFTEVMGIEHDPDCMYFSAYDDGWDTKEPELRFGILYEVNQA